MAAHIETWFINGQEYVEPKEAARFLGLKYKTIMQYIYESKIAVATIECRHMIPIDELQTYAASRRSRQQRQAAAERWI